MDAGQDRLEWGVTLSGQTWLLTAHGVAGTSAGVQLEFIQKETSFSRSPVESGLFSIWERNSTQGRSCVAFVFRGRQQYLAETAHAAGAHALAGGGPVVLVCAPVHRLSTSAHRTLQSGIQHSRSYTEKNIACWWGEVGQGQGHTCLHELAPLTPRRVAVLACSHHRACQSRSSLSKRVACSRAATQVHACALEWRNGRVRVHLSPVRSVISFNVRTRHASCLMRRSRSLRDKLLEPPS
eukprot:485225-Rhodomonas_salina.3